MKTLLSHLLPLGLVLSSLSGCIFRLTAHAQVSLSPLVEVSEAKNGQSSGVITVTNRTKEEFRARVYASPFTYDRDQGFEITEENSHDLSPFLRYAPRELKIPANSSRKVRYFVKFPPHQKDGEYRAILFTETLNLIPEINSQYEIKYINRIGTTLYIRNGYVEPNLVADSAKYNPNDGTIVMLFKNPGDAASRPKIEWNLKHNQQIVKSGKISSKTIVPKGERNIIIPTEDIQGNTQKASSLPKGQYQLSGKAEWPNMEANNAMDFRFDIVIP